MHSVAGGKSTTNKNRKMKKKINRVNEIQNGNKKFVVQLDNSVITRV